jgi:hypothetical protein
MVHVQVLNCENRTPEKSLKGADVGHMPYENSSNTFFVQVKDKIILGTT